MKSKNKKTENYKFGRVSSKIIKRLLKFKNGRINPDDETIIENYTDVLTITPGLYEPFYDPPDQLAYDT